MNVTLFKEIMDYVLHKLQQGHESDSMSLCAFNIFYPADKTLPLNEFIAVMKEYQNITSLVYTIVPVLLLKSPHTYLSICGVRQQ